MTSPAGVITLRSPYSVAQTMDRLVAQLHERSAVVYARIDQQAEVQQAGEYITPLQCILFGNPKAGGPAMAHNPLTALDLPLKIIAWEDASQQVWLAYNAAAYLQQRYTLPDLLVLPFALDALIAQALE